MRDISIKTRRRSIRLQGYDYAQEGMYFFTVCTYKRQLLFGDVGNGEVKLNDFGHVVCDEWRKSTDIRREIALDAFVVMPNHVHGIVMVTDRDVGATGGSPFSSGPSKHSLAAFIAGFKAAVTKRINAVRNTPEAAVWQRNYYEHVIRNEGIIATNSRIHSQQPRAVGLRSREPEAKGDRPGRPYKEYKFSLSRSGV